MTTILVGEAWGKDEETMQSPFVGAAGQELYRMMGEAGWHTNPLPYNFISPYSMSRRWDSFPGLTLLNVFNCRPPDPEHKNRVEYFYSTPREGKPIDKTLPSRAIGQSKGFVLEKYTKDVHLLRTTLSQLKPNLIIALGNTALWALGLSPAIGKLRGSIIQSPYGKVLPIYHPAAVLRNWSLRIVAVIDFIKAKREAKSPDLSTLSRQIWTEPTIQDLYSWWNTYGKTSSLLAVDIETLRKTQISEVGIASSPSCALHIPFLLETKTGNKKTYSRYWSEKDEILAWKFVKMVCESDVPKIGQNFCQYDAYWLMEEFGIRLHNILHDTMVMAHCWQPELDKNLGFLGSIFCDEQSWKHIRKDVAKGED